MNELISAMITDMHIPKCADESENEYICRIIYSALGQWCLKSASAVNYGGEAITKHKQTLLLKNLLNQYKEIFPFVESYFSGNDEPAVHIRRLYEETGYLLTDNKNHNQIANYGRTLNIGNKYLFFGEPNEDEVNGLGLFDTEERYNIGIKDLLIRDSLNCEEYINHCFDLTDFEEYFGSENEYLFFNPHLDKPISVSWCKNCEDEFVIAKNDGLHQFLLIQKYGGKIYFKDFSVNEDVSELTAYDYRRLYFALKSYYKHPVKVWINSTDDTYSRIRLSSQLPNREYFLLLLTAWPIGNVFNKNEFLIKNEYLEFIIDVLSDIGVKGERNGK